MSSTCGACLQCVFRGGSHLRRPLAVQTILFQLFPLCLPPAAFVAVASVPFIYNSSKRLVLTCRLDGTSYHVVVGLGMFFMSNDFGIMARFGLGVDLWWFWGFEHLFCL